MRWFPVAFPTIGVFIVARTGLELTTPMLSLHAKPLHRFKRLENESTFV